MPPLLGRLCLEAFHLSPRLAEFRVGVPGLPVGARLPRADDHALGERVDRDRHLSGDPARLIPRGLEPLTHGGVPPRLAAFLELHTRDDRHHGRCPPFFGPPPLTASRRCRRLWSTRPVELV